MTDSSDLQEVARQLCQQSGQGPVRRGRLPGGGPGNLPAEQLSHRDAEGALQLPRGPRHRGSEPEMAAELHGVSWARQPG